MLDLKLQDAPHSRMTQTVVEHRQQQQKRKVRLHMEFKTQCAGVTAVNLSLIRLDHHEKRSTLSSLQYEISCLP